MQRARTEEASLRSGPRVSRVNKARGAARGPGTVTAEPHRVGRPGGTRGGAVSRWPSLRQGWPRRDEAWTRAWRLADVAPRRLGDSQKLMLHCWPGVAGGCCSQPTNQPCLSARAYRWLGDAIVNAPSLSLTAHQGDSDCWPARSNPARPGPLPGELTPTRETCRLGAARGPGGKGVRPFWHAPWEN